MPLADRDAIMSYLAEDNIVAALALDEAFEAHADRACKAPTLYRPGRMKGTREIVIRPNYVMVYQVDGDAIVMLRVLHAMQEWPSAGDVAKKGESE